MRGKKFGGRRAGTPNRLTFELREAARQYAGDALATLVGLMRHSRSEKMRLAASEALLDRGFGKPAGAIAGPLVNVNVGLPPPGGRPLTPAEAYAYVMSGTLPRDEELALIEQLQEAARRPAIEHEPIAVQTSADA